MPHRTTVTFSDQAWQTIDDLSRETGEPMSEIIRHSLSLYRWYRTARAMGQHVLVERDGHIREVVSLD